MRTQGRNVKYLFLALLFVCAQNLFAKVEIVDGVYYDCIESGRTASVIRRYDAGANILMPYIGDVVIPARITGSNGTVYTVKYISTDAFQGCTELTSVTLPETIVTIFSRAFFGCTSLTSITIPSSLEEIGQAAFYGCTSLSSVIDLDKSKVKVIDANAFCQCGSLADITFPNTIETIGNSAFENAMTRTRLFDLHLPASLKRIGDKAFLGIRLSSVFIPRNVTNIGLRAFETSECTSLSVDLANNVFDSRSNCNAIIDKWNKSLLFGCDKTVIPEDITTIASYAFSGCQGITSVVIPKSVTNIGSYAFFCCFQLKKVAILGDVTELQESCFNMCPITELVLPSSLQKIGHASLNSLMMSKLELPENLYFIADGAISSNRILEIIFPASLTYLGSKAVMISSTGTTFMFRGDVPGYVHDDAFGSFEDDHNPVAKHTLKVKENLADAFVGTPWSKFGTTETYDDIIDLDPSETDVENVARVDLIDGQVYDATNYRIAETLTYTRNFQNTNWQAWYVPFPMAYSDWSENFEIGRINSLRMYDTDDDGELDDTEMEVIMVTGGNIYPNHPYFIRAKNTGKQTFTLSNAMVYPAEKNTIDCSTVETKFEFTGTYTVVSGSEMVDNRYYALSRGQFTYTTNTNAYLNPNRWYMNIANRGSQVYHNNVPARMRITVKGEEGDILCEDYSPADELFDGEEYVTGICTTPVADTHADAPVFTLEGIRVDATGTLQPGVYIRNGKKYIVR